MFSDRNHLDNVDFCAFLLKWLVYTFDQNTLFDIFLQNFPSNLSLRRALSRSRRSLSQNHQFDK